MIGEVFGCEDSQHVETASHAADTREAEEILHLGKVYERQGAGIGERRRKC